MPVSGRSVERRLLGYSRRARAYLYLAITTKFLAVGILLLQAWLLSLIVSGVFIDGQSLDDVSMLLLGILALAVARAGLIWSGDLLAQRSASWLKNTLRAALTRQFLDLGPSYTRRQRSGDLVNTAVQGVEDLNDYIADYLPLRMLSGLVPVLVALVIFVLDPWTVLVLIITGPLLVLFLILIGSRAKTLVEQRYLELGWMSAYFLDMLQGLPTLKMFGRSREQIQGIRNVSQRYATTTMTVLRTAFETSFVLEMAVTIATALVAVEVSLRLMDGQVTFEHALAVLIITPEFFAPLRQLATRYHAGAAGKAAAEAIFTVLDEPLKRPAPSSHAKQHAVPVRMDIRFSGVDLSYDEGQRQALDGISLHIPDGQVVAMVGATGAGKSSVANLLLRFFEPDRGTISVDGTPLSDLDLKTWRSHLAWVPQQPHLFHGTVADNIRIARADANDEEVAAAATAANAHEFITALPHGYDTPIGEQGMRLSGGQRQRLAIARAFLKNASFLILDEPTSHLDGESEDRIQDALHKLLGGRTALIIAHRLKLANAADMIVVLQQGKVIESGSHQSLLAVDGEYGRLVASYETGAP